MTNINKIEDNIIKSAFEFVNSLINSPAKEIGELFADQVRYIRFKNQINIINKAQKFLEKKKIKPRNIPLKTLANLLEYSSYEEDKDMQDKWAALLSNATDPNNNSNLHNILAEILNQISPQESFILDYLYENSFIISDKERYEMPISQLTSFKFVSYTDSLIIIDNLKRLNLIESSILKQYTLEEMKNQSMPDKSKFQFPNEQDNRKDTRIRLSYMGIELVEQCSYE